LNKSGCFFIWQSNPKYCRPSSRSFSTGIIGVSNSLIQIDLQETERVLSSATNQLFIVYLKEQSSVVVNKHAQFLCHHSLPFTSAEPNILDYRLVSVCLTSTLSHKINLSHPIYLSVG
jgi:hypothetical protein